MVKSLKTSMVKSLKQKNIHDEELKNIHGAELKTEQYACYRDDTELWGRAKMGRTIGIMMKDEFYAFYLKKENSTPH